MIRWLIGNPRVMTWTTDKEYRLVGDLGESVVHLAAADEREHVLWAVAMMKQQPPPVIRNMFDVMRAGIDLQGREDTFSGMVRLTASQRSYVAGALTEAYLSGSVAGPSINRGKWHADVAEAVLGPLRLER